MRGLAGSQGTDQWSLDGSMDYGALWLYYGVPRCCHKRGCTGFQGAVHWSLSGSRGSYGVPPLLPQEEKRGCTGFQGAVHWSLRGSRAEGPMVFSKATRGAVQNLRMLVNGL